MSAPLKEKIHSNDYDDENSKSKNEIIGNNTSTGDKVESKEELHADQADSTHVVAQVWPNLTESEVAELLSNYPTVTKPFKLLNHSTRPLSAAALVQSFDRVIVVKRHHQSVRSVASLNEEHAFIKHLRKSGFSTPDVLADVNGNTVSSRSDEYGNGWIYEVFERAEGEDKYQGRNTWTPFDSENDAHAAGMALAKLHLAAKKFDAPLRRPAVLLSRPHIFGAVPNPLESIEELFGQLPGLQSALQGRPWHTDLKRHVERAAELTPILAELPQCWTQNDFHSSNLLWGNSTVSSVIDFGLSDRTTRVFDLAIALERNTLQWPELLSGNQTAYRLDQAAALLSGYNEVAPLTREERDALPSVIPLCQADAALHAIAYYAGVLKDSAMVEWGYSSFLLDHTYWFDTDAGQNYLTGLQSLIK